MAPLGSCQDCFPAEALQPSQGEPSLNAHGASKVLRSSVWVLASWNVRTLLDVDGPIETARQGADDMQVVDERKIDQVVNELGKYKVDVAALQETKWFGNEMYRVGKSVVLAAGRPVPGAGGVRQRGGGLLSCCPGLRLVHGWPVVGNGEHGALD